MRTQNAKKSKTRKLRLALGLSAVAGLAVFASPASAGSGGTGTTGADAPKGSKATLVDGLAVAPADAPQKVVDAIEAANEIAKGPGYCLGGGHAKFKARCYDCSGAVSYALKGAGLVKRPKASSGYFRWGKRGKGDWITVYTNSGHMYVVIAGLRFDTSQTIGKGPGWSAVKRSGKGYKKRHKSVF